jgi:hypothetical protein
MAPNVLDVTCKYQCTICFRKYATQSSLSNHNRICNIKDEDKELIKNALIKVGIEKEISTIKISTIKGHLSHFNNQVLSYVKKSSDIVKKKYRIIDEIRNNKEKPTIQNVSKEIIANTSNNKTNQEETRIHSLTFDNISLVSRIEDGYINATELCKRGGKLFSEWNRLESTKKLLKEAESRLSINYKHKDGKLVDIKRGNSSNYEQGSWIHPDLIMQLAQWISPSFALQVSSWIRTLLTNGHVEVDIKNNQEMLIKDQRIKLLEDTYLKKHKRKTSDAKNVIYVVTSEDNRKRRIYKIGRTLALKSRLSQYNTSMEHEVVYHKSCKNEKNLGLIKTMIFNRLDEFREVANRERFILPQDKEISFFTDVIDNCINFFQ